MLNKFYDFVESAKKNAVLAIIICLTFGFLITTPSVYAQDGSGDPVVNVEVTVGSASGTGTTGDNFAWRDQISTVPVTINCTDKDGKVVPNASVSISVTSPGLVTPTSGTTDDHGNVYVTVSSTDISMDDATVTVSASSQNASGSGSVLLKGIKVTFSPNSVRMGVFYPATDTATVVPAYDAARIGITTTGQSRATVTASPGDAKAGTILLLLFGQSGSSSKSGDEWLVPDVSGSNKPMAPIVVVVPSKIATTYPTLNTTPVTPVN